MTTSQPFAPARAHGALDEIFPGVFFVTGGFKMTSLLSFSRNMTVLREGERLIIVNSMRLSEAGLAALDALGRVTDVIRIAGFHGADDAFYKDRYGATVWVLRGHTYQRGLEPRGPEYFTPDRVLDADSPLPIAGARLFIYESNPREGLIILDRDGGIVIAGDSLQNWHTPNQHFSFFAGPVMRVLGYIKPCNVGPGWLKLGKPPAADLARVLELSFEHVVPVHGDLVTGGAKEKFRPALERTIAKLAARS